MNEIISQTVGIVSSVIIAYIVFMKDIKKILVGEFCVNFTVAVSYFLLGRYLGAGVCVVGTVHSVASYIYKKKNCDFPLGLTSFFIVLYISLATISYQSVIDLMPAVCSVLFGFAIIQKTPQKYNVFNSTKSAVWVIYDILIGAYTTAFAHMIIFVSALAAIYRMRKIGEKN